MNFFLHFGIALVAVVCAVGFVAFVTYWRRPRYTPAQQIFIDARNLIERVGLSQNNFTPHGTSGIGDPKLPHCVLAAVAACDPAFPTEFNSVYILPSTVFLRDFSLRHLGMYPEDVNDKLGQEAVQELLLDAADQLRH